MKKIIRDILPLRVPLLMWIDPTNMCNFKCVFCPTGDDELLKKVGRPKGMMTMKTFNKIIDDLKLMVKKYSQRPVQISLYKDGEPLLNKNLSEMIKIVKDAKITDCVEITTNASALTEKKSREIIEAGLDKIRFSIEHVSDEGYEKIVQKKISFEKIVKNVQNFWKINKEYSGRVQVHTKIVNTNLSNEEENEFLNTFKSYTNTIKVNYLHGWSNGSEKDFALNTNPAKSALGEKLIKKNVCSQPFTRLTILFNGEATACCVDWAHKLVSGNVNDTSLDQIWNRNTNKLRMSHLNHEVDKKSPCYDCQYLLGYQDNEVLDGEENRLKQFYQ